MLRVRLPFRRLVVIGVLLAVPAPLFWLVQEKTLDEKTYGFLCAFALGLVALNVWDQRRVNRVLAMKEVGLARDLLEKGQFQAAMTHLDAATRHDGTCFEIRVARGEVHLGEQDFDGARRVLVEALGLRPDSVRAHYALGLTHLNQKKALEAASEFTRTLELDPDFTEVHFILAQAWELAGEKARALGAYRTYLDLAGQIRHPDPKTQDCLARSYARVQALQ